MRFLAAAVVFLAIVPLSAQKGPSKNSLSSPKSSSHVKAFAARSSVSSKEILTPLNPRERVTQLLGRFTFGPRPGEVDRVLAIGTDSWLEQQLSPEGIDESALEKRLADYATLMMTPQQALTVFPDRGVLQAVANERLKTPTDPELAAVYEVQLYKLNNDLFKKKDKKISPDQNSVSLRPEDEDLARQKQKEQDQQTAAHIAGELFALPRDQRMATLIKRPVADRVAFTTYVSGEQRGLLLSQFTPREREIFNAMASNGNSSQQLASELSQAKILRVILSERQLQEIMTDFWFNHFNIFIGKNADQWYTTSYERDAIRKNALGKFHDLLIATATSPAMMVYLDNWLSIGPDSLANGVNRARPKAKKGDRGLNENYGRELMELHTLGVNGGYTQADVIALSSIFTGWTVDHPQEGGPFFFESRRHEPGPKQWYGHTINASASDIPVASAARTSPDQGMNEGIQALTFLAASPRTANFICYKLAQRFVADDPPPALVDRMVATWLSTEGDIKAILRTLIHSPEFNSKQYFRNKIKTPLEFVASAFRTTDTDPVNPGAIVQTLRTMGMPLYYALPPTGYILTADRWMNSAALIERLNFAYALTSNKFSNQKFDSEHVLALGLLSQPSILPASKPHYAETALSTASGSTGQDLALQVLESSLLTGNISSKTHDLIHHQVVEFSKSGAHPSDTLNLLTALIMGSPEFQLR